MQDVLAVGAFRRCGQAEKDLRCKMAKQLCVSSSRRVVELVDHNKVPSVWFYLEQVKARKALNRGEHALARRRPLPIDVQATEFSVAQNLAEGCPTLRQYLLAVRNEK